MKCDFCEEDFEDEQNLHVHWMEEHEDELNSHQKDEAKKAKREKEEEKKQERQRKKSLLFQGTGVAVVLILLAVLGPQIVDTVVPSGNTASNITIENQPMIGNESAEVTVVEFGDFQCPACASFEGSAYQQLKTNYIDTGQVRFVWKDFPLESIHPWARTGAETMECVYRQDEQAFWNVKNTLFTQQDSLNQGNVQDQIIQWAENEGVNADNLRSCTNSQEASQATQQDISEGRSNGVDSTPTVLVNGEEVQSNYQSIRQAIEQELNN